jgi:hypothetical protein
VLSSTAIVVLLVTADQAAATALAWSGAPLDTGTGGTRAGW